MSGSIRVASRRRKILPRDNLKIFDVTSRSSTDYVRFSPFYPHRGIPVPFWAGRLGASVEGIWQALKIFEREGIDLDKLENTSMKDLKRSETKNRGHTRGHLCHDDGNILSYVLARQLIYVPTYEFVLNHYLQKEIQEIKELLARGCEIVFLDYNTNTDVMETSSPLSHASIIIRNIS